MFELNFRERRLRRRHEGVEHTFIVAQANGDADGDGRTNTLPLMGNYKKDEKEK